MGQCIVAEIKNRNEHQITLQDQDDGRLHSVNSSLLAGIDNGFFIEKALKYSKKDEEQRYARKESYVEGNEQAKDDQGKRLFLRQDCKADFTTENSQSQESEKEEDDDGNENNIIRKDQENNQYSEVNDYIANNLNNNNNTPNNNIQTISNNSQILKKSNSSSYPANPVIPSSTATNPVQRQVSFQKQCSIQKQLSIAKQLSIQKQNSVGLKQGSSFLSTFPTQLLSPRSTQSQANLGLFTSQSSLNPQLKVSYANGVANNNNNTNPGSNGITSQLSNIPSSTNSLPTSSSNIMQTITSPSPNITTNNTQLTSNSNPNITSSSAIPDKNILSPNNPRRTSSQDRRSRRKNPSDKKMSLTVIDFSNRFNNHQSVQQQLLSPHRVSSQQTEFEEILALLNRQNVDVYIIQQLCDTFLEHRRREYGDQAEEFQEAVRNLSVVLFKQQLNDLGRFYLDQLVLQKKVSTQQNLLKNLHEYQKKHV